jgi:hypothetical protein
MTKDSRRTERQKDEAGPVAGDREEHRPKGRERRQASRLDVELWVEEISGENQVFRRTGNVSLSGVFFESALPHPVGSELTLRIPLLELEPPEMVIVKGQVVRPAPGGVGMGVRFVEFEGSGEQHLKKYLCLFEEE